VGEHAEGAIGVELFGLGGRVCVVTGASSGLGERFARVLSSAGATVVLASRRVERLEAVAAGLAGPARVVGCDVRSERDRERLIAETVETFGRIDVLLNNAGITRPQPAEDESEADWNEVLEVNLNAVFRMSQLAARLMLAQQSGSIVNVASVLGLVASAPIRQAAYCASKGAVVNLTRELGCQWARRGVRVNALAPGWFPSEMTAESVFEDERSLAFLRRNCPMGRGGREHELDGALLFLASDASSYVTGQTIVVDGGWTAR
jgi:NAD(P)-dependent dehydrogenase (short-subunit alcohol dehydrogenase family)